MANNDKLIRANFAFILFILIAVCVNLNARVRILETSNSDLQRTIQTQKDELEKIEEKNTMQDVILNKLNNDYNSRMAWQLQEVADENGAYQDGARYEKYKKENRMPSSAIIAKFVGFVETDLLYECMKESLDKVGPGRSSEDLVERFYRDNHNYKRNEERKRERRLKRKLEALDLILKMEGWD